MEDHKPEYQLDTYRSKLKKHYALKRSERLRKGSEIYTDYIKFVEEQTIPHYISTIVPQEIEIGKRYKQVILNGEKLKQKDVPHYEKKIINSILNWLMPHDDKSDKYYMATFTKTLGE